MGNVFLHLSMACEIAPEVSQLGEDLFDWNGAWYPVAPLTYLNAEGPNPIKRLARKLGQWCGMAGNRETLHDTKAFGKAIGALVFRRRLLVCT